MGRRYYIPITRSGSSMLASVLTQAIRNPSSKGRHSRHDYYPETMQETYDRIESGKLKNGFERFVVSSSTLLALSFMGMLFMGWFIICLKWFSLWE